MKALDFNFRDSSKIKCGNTLSFFSIHSPPDDDFLKSAREQRLKEVRMSEILKEISAYFLFVFVLVVVAYGNRDPNAYLLSKNLRDIFVEVDDTGVDLADVRLRLSL